MNRTLEFSFLKKSDLQEVLEIERESFPDPWSENLFTEELDGDPRRLNATLRVKGRLAGYCLGWVVGDEFHLGNLAVKAEFRQRGFGAMLLCHILEKASERGCQWATLEVRVSNLAALKLYQRFGFKEVAIRKKYYGNEDALVMMAPLPFVEDVAAQ